MTAADRIRRVVAELEASCAYIEGDPDPVCFWLDEVPFITLRRVKIALARGRCPLCYWTLIFSFGPTREETAP